MEKDRTIIAIVLSLLVILVYFHFFAARPQPTKPQPQVPATPVKTSEPAQVTVPAQEEPPSVSSQPEQQELPEEPAVDPETGEVATGTLTVGWSNSSAAINRITITDKRDEKYIYPDYSRENPLGLIFSEDEGDYSLRLCKQESIEDIAAGNWKVLEKNDREIVMQSRIPGGPTITKQLIFQDKSYHVRFKLTLKNETQGPLAPNYRILVANGILDETGRRSPGGAVVARKAGGKFEVDKIPPTKLTDEEPRKEYTAGGSWTGLENMYFAAVLAPEDEITSGAVSSILIEKAFGSKKEKDLDAVGPPGLLNMRVILVSKEIPLKPGEEVVHQYLFFAGPKQDDVLDSYKSFGFSSILDYGWFGFLSKLFLTILRGIYYVLPNWGVAIIILTLIVRLCLHPVSRKSQMSMQKYQRAMQKLKPKLDKLKEKLKNNREKLTKETMKLYREEGVSMFPAGGCLLMLLQIPVFIGLYWALSLSIELRQAYFLFWIDDLSQPDCLFNLGGNIPILGTSCVNILPVIMLAAMIFQQKTQPRAADPQQAQQQKMTMYIMLFVIGFIFYNMPSGLVLYFLTSTLVGLGETKMIKRKLAAEETGD